MTPEQQEMLTKARAKLLWCVHVLGPDELHAMPSYEAAEKNVKELVEALYTPKLAALDVLCLPIVAVWPWSAVTHRDELAKAGPTGGVASSGKSDV